MDTKTRLLVFIATIIGIIGLYSNIKNRSVMQKPPTNIAPEPTNAELLLSKKDTEIVTSDVIYSQDINGKEIIGFYAVPKHQEKYPGIVMVHDQRGLNDPTKDIAKELAKEGYQVLAVDLYKRSLDNNQQESILNLKAAMTYLEKNNAPRVGVFGFGVGGGDALQLSLQQPLDATVIYYGMPLVTDTAQLASITGPVLGIFGDNDKEIPVAKVNEFKSALDKTNIKNKIIIYSGVTHGFADPTGQAWSAQATRDSWSATLQFLQEYLK